MKKVHKSQKRSSKSQAVSQARNTNRERSADEWQPGPVLCLSEAQESFRRAVELERVAGQVAALLLSAASELFQHYQAAPEYKYEFENAQNLDSLSLKLTDELRNLTTGLVCDAGVMLQGSTKAEREAGAAAKGGAR